MPIKVFLQLAGVAIVVVVIAVPKLYIAGQGCLPAVLHQAESMRPLLLEQQDTPAMRERARLLAIDAELRPKTELFMRGTLKLPTSTAFYSTSVAVGNDTYSLTGGFIDPREPGTRCYYTCVYDKNSEGEPVAKLLTVRDEVVWRASEQ